MKRRSFIQQSSMAASLPLLSGCLESSEAEAEADTVRATRQAYPLAITMWEFSWLERRWPGAGYEDWDKALSELVERGYDAVRIDAFPHLVAAAPEKKWGLNPHWDNQAWGSPVYTEVQVQPQLNDFIRSCKKHGVRVGLSTWWREDTEAMARRITSPQDLGTTWLKTLDSIDRDLLDTLIFVDLSNEYPISVWTPYLPKGTLRNSELGRRYAHESIQLLKARYPDIPFCFSITTEYDQWKTEDVSMQDLLECHIWIANSSDFNQKVGYDFQRFGHDDYKNLQLKGEKEYRAHQAHYLDKLQGRIDLCADWSKLTQLPLVTTECWGPIDYKDMPLLDWGWVKEACAFGTTQAAQTGRWLAISTSNFCGPQFVGMWRDIAYHQRLTDLIHQAPVAADLKNSLLAQRMRQAAPHGDS